MKISIFKQNNGLILALFVFFVVIISIFILSPNNQTIYGPIETTTTQSSSLPTSPPVTEFPKPIDAKPVVTNPVADLPEEHIVEIRDLRFDPGELTIFTGETVKWVNKDVVDGNPRPHLVKDQYNEFRSERLYENDEFTHTFDEPGTYTYIDAIFSSNMKSAKIIVVERSLITGSAVRDFDVLPMIKTPMLGVIMLISLLGLFVGRFIGLSNKKGQSSTYP
ncbi:MAG: hypothetical protein ABII01_05775 [Candidatus Woesearchaeota archaeon]